jgi:hypothetical protein
MTTKVRSVLFATALLFGASACIAEVDTSTEEQESHSWGNYHWGRSSNPFTVQLGDNVGAAWDSALSGAASDWNQSTVVNTPVVAGGTLSNTKKCRATTGRVEVCNNRYGNNGWLGVAQIWLSGGHITKGIVKLNDTYYAAGGPYDTAAWRNSVMCQEIGHTLGLDHNDEDFSTTTGTCMDYSNDPGPNQHPDSHDYQMLQTIYGHLDSTTTVGQMPAEMEHGDFSAQGSWGELMRTSHDGRVHQFVKDYGNGFQVVTTVTWAD